MNLKLSFLALVALISGCSLSTVVEPPPPCSSTLPSETLTVACTPPYTTPDPVGTWTGTLTTEAGSSTQTFSAVIELEADGGDYSGVFTVGDKTFSVYGWHSYTSDAGEELFAFQSPNEALVAQLTPAPFTGLSWTGPLTETTFSGTWTQREANDVVVQGTFALEREP